MKVLCWRCHCMRKRPAKVQPVEAKIRFIKNTEDERNFYVSFKTKTNLILYCVLWQGEVMTVLDHLALSPSQVCSVIVGSSCATAYNPFAMWNITLPDVPKPPVVPPKLPKVRAMFKSQHLPTPQAVVPSRLPKVQFSTHTPHHSQHLETQLKRYQLLQSRVKTSRLSGHIQVLVNTWQLLVGWLYF